MRAVVFMSRMVGMVIVMIGVLLAVFVLLDILREGPQARGFLIGSNVWDQAWAMLDRFF